MADVFTTVGKNLSADYFDGTANAPANWYGDWGTGTTGAAAGDTALGTPGGECRVVASESQPSANINQLIATLTEGGGGATIAEFGLFDASTSGNMPVRCTFAGIAVSNGDSIQFTLQITHS